MKYINSEGVVFGLCSEEVQEQLRQADNVKMYVAGSWIHRLNHFRDDVAYRAEKPLKEPETRKIKVPVSECCNAVTGYVRAKGENRCRKCLEPCAIDWVQIDGEVC